MKPRVLLLDIETSPLTGYAWGSYDTNILKVLEPSKIICVGWKWLGEKETHVRGLPDYPGYKGGVIDDRHLVADLWELLDKADVVIAHNGDTFDVKKANARFIYYEMDAPSAFKSVDTRKVAKKYFRFDNNHLDGLGQYLGEGRKVNTGGFELWDRCIEGDPVYWARMKRYNRRDVDLLEQIYLRFRPFIDNHPNLNIIAHPLEKDKRSCPSCLSERVHKRGFSITRTGRRQRYQCDDCGSWSSGLYQKVAAELR